MDIVSRLIAFKNWTNLTSSQFADKARIPRPTLSQFINGRNKRLSDDLISKLHLAFPELNVLWLLFGQGEMLLNQNIQFSEPQIDDFQDDLFAQSTENQPDTSPEITGIFVGNFDQSTNLRPSEPNLVQNQPSRVNPALSTVLPVNPTPATIAQLNPTPATTSVNSTQAAATSGNPTQALAAEVRPLERMRSEQAPLPLPTHTSGQQPLSDDAAHSAVNAKRIKYITVFYDDNTYDVFNRCQSAADHPIIG